MEKLAAIVPRPAVKLVLFHGLLAPHARWRSHVVSYGRPAPYSNPPAPKPSPRAARPRPARGRRPHVARGSGPLSTLPPDTRRCLPRRPSRAPPHPDPGGSRRGSSAIPASVPPLTAGARRAIRHGPPRPPAARPPAVRGSGTLFWRGKRAVKSDATGTRGAGRPRPRCRHRTWRSYPCSTPGVR